MKGGGGLCPRNRSTYLGEGESGNQSDDGGGVLILKRGAWTVRRIQY